MSMKKFLLYPTSCHPKNIESMERMCKSLSIQFESTNDRNRLNHYDYDYIWLPNVFVSPDEIPEHIFILYGPHYFVFPDGSWLDGVRNEKWSKRCVFNVLSDWNYIVHNEFIKDSVIPMKPLPFGVNDQIECNRIMPYQYDCIIYFKNRHPYFLDNVLSIVNQRNMSFKVFSYGSYVNDDFILSARKSKFCIWIGGHESQGFAFQECLMTNTPILVLNSTSMFDECDRNGNQSYSYLLGKKELKATSATCWSDECGEICTIEDFAEKLDLIQKNVELNAYNPRKVIIEKRSDKVCMQNILNLSNNLF